MELREIAAVVRAPISLSTAAITRTDRPKIGKITHMTMIVRTSGADH